MPLNFDSMIKSLAKGAFKSFDWAFSQCKVAVTAFSEAYKEIQEEKAIAQESDVANDNPLLGLDSLLNQHTNSNMVFVTENMRQLLRNQEKERLRKINEAKDVKNANDWEIENMLLEEIRARRQERNAEEESRMKDEAASLPLKEIPAFRKSANERVEEKMTEGKMIEEPMVEEESEDKMVNEENAEEDKRVSWANLPAATSNVKPKSKSKEKGTR